MKNIPLILSTLLILLLLPFFAVNAKTDSNFNQLKDYSLETSMRCLHSENFQTIKFEKGVYNFYPDKAFGKFCFISNHDDRLLRSAFPIINKKNIVIDGGGATFIFHGEMIPFLIEHSENITIKNVTVDFDDYNTFYNEVEVIATHKKNRSIDVKISDKYPYVIKNNRLVFVKEYGEQTLGQSIFFDPETHSPVFKTELMSSWATKYKSCKSAYNVDKITYRYPKELKYPPYYTRLEEVAQHAEELKPGIVRLYNYCRELPPIGTILCGKGAKIERNRIAPGVRSLSNVNLKLENVTIHHAGGMGIICENCENVTLDRFKITPSKGRMVSVTADATHFVGCRGKITMTNCVFKNQLDDGTNIHGIYLPITDVIDENTLGVTIGHFQQLNFDFGRVGDTLSFVSPSKSLKSYAKAILKSIEKINSRYYIVKITNLNYDGKADAKLNSTKDAKSAIAPGDVLENVSAQPSVLIDNCDIGSNRARGLIIATSRGSVIRNNYFHTEMSALVFNSSYSFWNESGISSNILVERNTFKNCVTTGKAAPVISCVSNVKNSDHLMENIVIKNNTFDQYDPWILDETRTKDCKFIGNIIKTNDDFPSLFPDHKVVTTNDCINFQCQDLSGKTVEIPRWPKTLVSFFQKTPIVSPLVDKGAWGISAVLPRDTCNGLEDRNLEKWCYWDGMIVKGNDGRFHMYGSRWTQSVPHSAGWHIESKAINAVSDNLIGPYRDQGLSWPDHDGGKAHNVYGLKMKDGRYAMISSEITPGEVYVSDNPDGPWQYLGKIKYDTNGYNPGLARYNFGDNHMSNVTIMVRPTDGKYMLVPRSCCVMISEGGILGPYKIVSDRVYKDVPDINKTYIEDPTCWYSGGLYHIVANQHVSQISYHFVSKDGIHNWEYRGIAYQDNKNIFSYTNGVVNKWGCVQRPQVVMGDKHPIAFTFSVIDNSKGGDSANDKHGSKIIVVPFDGKAFDEYMEEVTRNEEAGYSYNFK